MAIIMVTTFISQFGIMSKFHKSFFSICQIQTIVVFHECTADRTDWGVCTKCSTVPNAYWPIAGTYAKQKCMDNDYGKMSLSNKEISLHIFCIYCITS